jgi:hypothetical protein
MSINEFETLILDRRYRLAIREWAIPYYFFLILDVSGSMFVSIQGTDMSLADFVVSVAFTFLYKMAKTHEDVTGVIIMYSSECAPDETEPLGKCMFVGNLLKCLRAGQECGDIYIIGRQILPQTAFKELLRRARLNIISGGTVPEPAFYAAEQVAEKYGIPYYDMGFFLTDGYIVPSTFVLPKRLRKPDNFYVYAEVLDDVMASKYVWRGNDVTDIVRHHTYPIPIPKLQSL